MASSKPQGFTSYWMAADPTAAQGFWGSSRQVVRFIPGCRGVSLSPHPGFPSTPSLDAFLCFQAEPGRVEGASCGPETEQLLPGMSCSDELLRDVARATGLAPLFPAASARGA